MSIEELIKDSYSPRQLAELLGMSPSGILIWRRKGIGPGYFKHGNTIRYPRSEVKAFLKQNLKGLHAL